MLPATLRNNLTPHLWHPSLVALTKSQLIACPASLFPLCPHHPQKPIKMMLPCSFPRFSNVPSCKPQCFLPIFPPSLQVPVPPLAWDESQFPRQGSWQVLLTLTVRTTIILLLFAGIFFFGGGGWTVVGGLKNRLLLQFPHLLTHE